MNRLENQEGKIYGHLLIRLDLDSQKYSGNYYSRYVLAECLNCSSNIKKYQLGHLRTGHTISCGCAYKEMNKTHGMTYTRQYRIWSDMIQRCKNKNNKEWENYGGRGISVCENWLSFDCFWSDMKEGYSDKLTIDRVDVNGNYNKENCRWTNGSDQAYNTRKQVNNKSGKTGVYFNKKSKKWCAYSYKNGKQHYLGLFETFDDAVKAREQSEIEFFGYNKN